MKKAFSIILLLLFIGCNRTYDTMNMIVWKHNDTITTIIQTPADTLWLHYHSKDSLLAKTGPLTAEGEVFQNQFVTALKGSLYVEATALINGVWDTETDTLKVLL